MTLIVTIIKYYSYYSYYSYSVLRKIFPNLKPNIL